MDLKKMTLNLFSVKKCNFLFPNIKVEDFDLDSKKICPLQRGKCQITKTCAIYILELVI
jgi:hypothetical protein